MLSSSHQNCLPLLYLNHPQPQRTIPRPLCHTFVRIILPFVTVLNHGSIILLFSLYETTLFISLMNGDI